MKRQLRPVVEKMAATAGSGLVLFALGASAAAFSQANNNAMQLSWDGVHYSSSTSQAFFDTPVIVPGDSARRTLLVRNAGPSDAMLRASITNVDLTHDRSDDFYDQLLIDWNTGQTTVGQLAANGETTIVDVQLAQGEEFEITIGYHLPQHTVEGNGRGGRLAGFDVQLDLAGMSTPAGD